ILKAIMLGDLSKQIKVDARGEILDLKNMVNGMVVWLQALAAEVTRVTLEAGSQGKLGGQAHVPDVKGVWFEFVQNMCSSLMDQVQPIAVVITAVAQGDLMQKVEIQGRRDLVNIVQGRMLNLSTLANEIMRVSLEVEMEGILGGQVFIPEVQGMWKVLLTDNVNLMTMNLMNQVHSIAQVTKAMMGGDLTKKIEVDMCGEILETINGMMESL
ncbi:hypothetical protein L208DRAFT_1196291, partial [Tricholoma matsutake]